MGTGDQAIMGDEMIDFGIYEIQQDENGKFFLTEQLSASSKTFDTIRELVEYIQDDLEAVQSTL